jgi:hypothetical protein
MAYRTKKRKSHRRRRIGKVATARRRRTTSSKKINAQRMLGLVLGAVVPVLAGKIKVGAKKEPIDGKIIGASALVIGFFLPQFIKGDLAAGAADGLTASGGVILLQEFDVLNGIPVIAGWKELPTVSGVCSDPEKAIHDQNQSSVFRPSITQIMNGMYNRRED